MATTVKQPSEALASPGVNEEASAQPEVDRQSRLDELYNKCAQAPAGTLFFQRELTSMHVVDTLPELTSLLQELVDRHLMKLMTFDNDPCWKLRSREDADKLRRLTPDERLLYHHIDQVQNEGVWSKALRARTNFNPQMLTKCLKSLESKDLVQSVMSVKFPNRKMYLLKHLKPSEDVAGGPWQSEGEFDTALIEIASKTVENLVTRDTCVMVPAGYNNFAHEDRSEAIAQKKAQVQTQDIEDLGVKPYRPPMKPRLVPRHDVKYPTAALLRDKLMATGIIKDKVVQENDMEQLLEMMVLDGRLEKISGTNYRLATRLMSGNERWNGFVDAPCGTCPVFEFCGDEGQISARTCLYFGEWLQTDSETYER